MKGTGNGIILVSMNSNFDATKCSISSNKGNHSIIIVEDHSNISLTETVLKRNFVKNVWTKYGSIRCSLAHIRRRSQLHFILSNVKSNSADGSCAGIFIEKDSLLVSESSEFSRNKAYHSGSTYCDKSSIHWKESTFLYNKATFGGVLKSVGCSVKIEDCQMAYNEAKHNGGSLASSYDTLQVSQY